MSRSLSVLFASATLCAVFAGPAHAANPFDGDGFTMSVGFAPELGTRGLTIAPVPRVGWRTENTVIHVVPRVQRGADSYGSDTSSATRTDVAVGVRQYTSEPKAKSPGFYVLGQVGAARIFTSESGPAEDSRQRHFSAGIGGDAAITGGFSVGAELALRHDIFSDSGSDGSTSITRIVPAVHLNAWF